MSRQKFQAGTHNYILNKGSNYEQSASCFQDPWGRRGGVEVWFLFTVVITIQNTQDWTAQGPEAWIVFPSDHRLNLSS